MAQAPTIKTQTGPGGISLIPGSPFSSTDTGPVEGTAEEANAIMADVKGTRDTTSDADTAATLSTNETTAVDGAVSSAAQIIEQEEGAADTINNATLSDPSREAIDLLDAEMDRLTNDLRGEEGAINEQFDRIREQQSGEQEGERGQTSVALAQAGGYLGFSGSGTGVMLSLAKSHRAELADLAAKRRSAIAQARQASANKRTDLVRLQAGEITRIDQEIYNRQQDYNKNLQVAQAEETERNRVAQTQTDIFNAIATGGSNDVSDIFQALKGKVPLSEINDYLEGLVPDSVKDIGSGFKFTTGNTAKLLGAGLGQDDIAALNEYVNENGYDETARDSLTPAQRAAADKIFRETPKKITGEDDVDLDAELTHIEMNRVKTLYGFAPLPGMTMREVNEFVNDNPGIEREEMQEAMDELAIALSEGGEVGTGDIPEITSEWFYSNFTTSQLLEIARDKDFVHKLDFRTKKGDIEALLADDTQFNKLKLQIEEAYAAGFNIEEIKARLTQ